MLSKFRARCDGEMLIRRKAELDSLVESINKVKDFPAYYIDKMASLRGEIAVLQARVNKGQPQ